MSPVLGKALASVLDAIQPPAFTWPSLPTFSDDRELATTGLLVLPSEFRRSSTEIGRLLMREVYDQIFEFERGMRRFIDEEMTRACGSDWIKHRIPEDMRQECREKQAKAVKDGEVASPLINYADFGDYEKTILRRDNWGNVFKSYFRRKESVQESFRRIHPVRRSTMHSRIITPDHRLFLAVEVRRIRLMIDRKNSGTC